MWLTARHCALFCVLHISPLFLFPKRVDAGRSIPGVEVLMPPSHIALSGDLHIQIKSSSFPPLLLQLSRLEGDVAQSLTTFSVLPEARALSLNTTIVKIPCGYFSRGGQYYVLLKKQPINSEANKTDEESLVITRTLDVRWPMPQLSLTPEHVQTYPELPVTAILEFPEVVCPPVADNPPSAIQEFWLELHYCGHSLLTCDSNNQYNQSNHLKPLYSLQVRGFPGRQVIILPCELFGLAGHYTLLLRPTTSTPFVTHTAAYVKAEWSDRFVFNVHARSIFPCDVHSGGITVLFQYPSCILAEKDKIRLYARLRVDVESLAPPTTLMYVEEKRVIRGQHSLHFNCDLFSERYVEYCFVYVSQAINGAVADVRMDCVPTLPVSESESGGWSEWSEWSQCSSTCLGGTRNRYRTCDSPPPRYGAKFCEGPRIETEKCGFGIGNNWECFYGNAISYSNMPADIPEVQAEIGPYCRCGCVVHLGHTKPRRLLATSSQSCPGRTFWLIQADDDYTIQFKVERFYLPCENQWLKVRDGNSLSATLLEYLTGLPEPPLQVINSTGPNLLLEFFTSEISGVNHMCGGGFVAHATQKRSIKNLTVSPIAQEIGVIPLAAIKLTAVHIAAIIFLSGLLIATILLAAQYIFRYRKYHIAKVEDQDSLADPNASCVSLPLRTRASSSATLLSEVISLTRLRPHIKPRNKHARLRESVEYENEDEQEVTLAKDEESLSVSSTNTLTNQEETTVTVVPQTTSEYEITSSLPASPQYNETLRRSSTVTTTCSEKDKTTEKQEVYVKDTSTRRLSNVSNITLANGYYSPAASLVSRATIRSTNPKESKDKRNREKLLAGPGGSEFSLSGPDADLEIDYYDYNVTNAGAAPGSYLGMDPAFLVWIPPLDESGEILPLESAENRADLRPKHYIDPGSNKESPEEEMLLPKSGGSPPLLSKLPKKVYPLVEIKSLSTDSICYEKSPLVRTDAKVVTIQLHEFPKCKLGLDSPVRVHREKETKVEKSPSIDSNILDEIKFADDDDDDLTEENQCNRSYQDSNIISSS